MQPFDALSIRAVLQEAKPLLLNRRVDKVLQLGRDEILIELRSKAGNINLCISAQSVYGRICLVKLPSSHNTENATSGRNKEDGSLQERYRSRYNNQNPPLFCAQLKKVLTGATLVGIEQMQGERVVDFIFSCVNEVGSASFKVITAEIMGRHSNLIFWDKQSEKILIPSHPVTRDMSRQREILSGLPYKRPPVQERPNIFSVSKEKFLELVQELRSLKTSRSKDSNPEFYLGSGSGSGPGAITLEQWLVSTFTGIGRHLSEELVKGSSLPSCIEEALSIENFPDTLWERIALIQNPQTYGMSARLDLSRYSIAGFLPEVEPENLWQKFPSINDMIEYYYRTLETRETYNQLKERLKSEINAEAARLETRKKSAEEHLASQLELERLKSQGDLILANLSAIKPGQKSLEVESWSCEGKLEPVVIELNPSIPPAQNAQAYYRRFAKQRARQTIASSTMEEVENRLAKLEELERKIEQAPDTASLRLLKQSIIGKKPSEIKRQAQSSKPRGRSRLLSVQSSDGWTIYAGRNRIENDYLLNKLANPNDLWFHILGQGGAHVLIRVPASQKTPPKRTIEEAAQIAARLSKAQTGSKVRVIYTQCKHVRKLGKNKTGQVRYENENTVEIEIAQHQPAVIRKLFKT